MATCSFSPFSSHSCSVSRIYFYLDKANVHSLFFSNTGVLSPTVSLQTIQGRKPLYVPGLAFSECELLNCLVSSFGWKKKRAQSVAESFWKIHSPAWIRRYCYAGRGLNLDLYADENLKAFILSTLLQ